ncbi:MAG: PEGA domain-containing protein [Spirochaetales bacterium]|nr:PEGA domain-containing protein [Spirochaetales bacterium]
MISSVVKKTLVIVCLTLFITVTYATAQDTNNTANFFIESNPLHANIIIDGKPVIETTPALIKNLSAGTHKIGLRKEGFSPINFEVELKEAETSSVKVELSYGKIVLSISEAEKTIFPSLKNKELSSTILLPEGQYKFTLDDESVKITPTYPKEALLGGVTSLLAVSLFTTSLCTLIEIGNKGELLLPHSNFLVISESATVILGMTELALIIDKNHTMKNLEVYDTNFSENNREAAALLTEAQEKLAAGRLEESLSKYSEIISNYPDFNSIPEALYRTAKIHLITHNTNLAKSELSIIINNYPTPEVYDKACQTLAVLYFDLGDITKSKEIVEKMVFYDPLFSDTKEEIQKNGIESLIRNWAGFPEEEDAE